MTSSCINYIYCIDSCRLVLPDENYVINKTFSKYLTTPHRGIAQDMLFYCCHEYVELFGAKGLPNVVP